ncbi:class I mannose-6-phosphate isomerase [Streptomyces sp. NPDC093111]|uniref:class I mannose-6-phosphate isomerase n=1 Tax=Streptomyces sp. NPDC093111 TaxID=3154978 RepID=UPI0034196F1A
MTPASRPDAESPLPNPAGNTDSTAPTPAPTSTPTPTPIRSVTMTTRTPELTYDREPRYRPVGGTVGTGWDGLVESLPTRGVTVAVDGPAVLDWDLFSKEVQRALSVRGAAVRAVDVRRLYAPWEKIVERTAAGPLADDPFYLPLARNPLSDLFDSVLAVEGGGDWVTLVFGPGAAEARHDVLWYADLPKRYAEQAHTEHRGTLLGRADVVGRDLRRLFYVDWPMIDRQRDALAPRVDRWIDTQSPDGPAWLDGAALRDTLRELAGSPVRTRPYFNSTPWGGTWAQRELGFTPPAGNTALGYELMAPESGVLVGEDAAAQVELPFQLLPVLYPEQFLGSDVHRWFGTSFPIRFDYLDTADGGNLSLHLHPKDAYMREHFGYPYTQHETYYMTAVSGTSQVYLGLREDADPDAFRAAVEASTRGAEMDVAAHVNTFTAEQGQLFTIPAGTPHASGAGNVVLEVSATPYLYSLRFYDWQRLDAEGNPRPLAHEHAFANLDTVRTGASVARDLVRRPAVLRTGEGWREVVVGALDEMFYEVRRVELDAGALAEDDTADTFHILNVVEGDGVLVETEQGSHPLARFETLTVPAAAGAYRLRAVGTEPVKVVKSLVVRAPESHRESPTAGD